MKNIFYFLILAFSLEAQAGLEIKELSDASYNLIDEIEVTLKVCALDSSEKKHCAEIFGISVPHKEIKDVKSYESLEIDEEGIYTESVDFAFVNSDSSLKLKEGIKCSLLWFSYRYTPSEKLLGLSMGHYLKNRDDYFLECKK